MLTIDVPFKGGMGKLVPGGGREMTGVSFEFLMSLPLQPDKKQQQKARSAIANFQFPIGDFRLPIADFRLAIADLALFKKLAIGNRQSAILFIRLIDYSTLIMFAGERFTGDSIFTFNPPPEIDELAPLRTEWTKKIVFPLDRLTAGWAFHES